MNKIEMEVKERVDHLLSLVCNEQVSPEKVSFVSSELTRMAMLGTAPASCVSRCASKKKPLPRQSERLDHSESKERWIAR